MKVEREKMKTSWIWKNMNKGFPEGVDIYVDNSNAPTTLKYTKRHQKENEHKESREETTKNTKNLKHMRDKQRHKITLKKARGETRYSCSNTVCFLISTSFL